MLIWYISTQITVVNPWNVRPPDHHIFASYLGDICHLGRTILQMVMLVPTVYIFNGAPGDVHYILCINALIWLFNWLVAWFSGYVGRLA